VSSGIGASRRPGLHPAAVPILALAAALRLASCAAPVRNAPIDAGIVRAYLETYAEAKRAVPSALRDLCLEGATPTGQYAKILDGIARKRGLDGVGHFLRVHAKVAAVVAIAEGRIVVDDTGAFFAPPDDEESAAIKTALESPGLPDQARAELEARLGRWRSARVLKASEWLSAGPVLEIAVRAASRATTQTVTPDEFSLVLSLLPSISKAYSGFTRPEVFLVDTDG
jgi:hypothetical protein